MCLSRIQLLFSFINDKIECCDIFEMLVEEQFHNQQVELCKSEIFFQIVSHLK